MRTYLVDAAEIIDSAIFSGDVLWDTEEREAMKEYVDRWANAIANHKDTPDES